MNYQKQFKDFIKNVPANPNQYRKFYGHETGSSELMRLGTAAGKEESLRNYNKKKSNGEMVYYSSKIGLKDPLEVLAQKRHII